MKSLNELSIIKIFSILTSICSRGGLENTESAQNIFASLQNHTNHELLALHLNKPYSTHNTAGHLLQLASNGGHTDIVTMLLQTMSHAKIDIFTTILESSALMRACQNGHEQVVSLLLQNLSQPDQLTAIRHTTCLGDNALIFACENGHSETVQLLLNVLGDAITQPATEQEILNLRKAFLRACQNGHEQVVSLLLQNLSQPDQLTAIHHTTRLGDNALILACQNGHTQIIQLLLNVVRNADTQAIEAHVAPSLEKTLILACKQGYDDLVAFILTILPSKKQVSPLNRKNQLGNTAFMQACADGHDPLALRLLQLRHLSKSNGDAIIHRKNIHGMTTLMQASESGNPKVVKMLLVALQLRLKNIKPETLAANNVDIPSQLNRADNPRGYTALLLASEHGHTEVINLLLSTLRNANADIPTSINQTDYQGNTALIRAAENGNAEVVQLLLKTLQSANADIPASINHTDHQANTALIKASENGHTEVVNLLLSTLKSAHADIPTSINLADDQGNTALIKASKNGHVEVVNQLLHTLADTDKRSTMNHMNTYGLTALKIACYEFKKRALTYSGGQQFINIAYTLLEHGCCVENLDNDLLAYMIAKEGELNPNPMSWERIKEKILSIINNQDTGWVTEAFSGFANKNAREISQLHALMKWAILFGQTDLVTKMRNSAMSILTPKDTIQHLYWALKANKFAVADGVIAQLDEENKLTILDSAFTQLRQENFTCTQTAFTLYLHNQRSPKACPSSSTALSPSLFRDATGGGSSEPQTNNHMPRHK